MLHTFRRLALVCFLPAALALSLTLAGCAKKDPVTAANSGLQPADDEDGDDAEEDEGDGDNVANSSGETTPPKTNGVKPTNGQETPLIGEKPPTNPPADELYTVPEGEPEVLLKYLDKLDKRLQQLGEQAEGGRGLSPELQEGIFEGLKQAMQARRTAAERILANDKADAAARLRAVDTKLQALDFLQQVGESGATADLRAFEASLAEEEKLLEQVESLLAGDAKQLTAAQLDMAQNAAVALLRGQHVDDGVAVLNLIGEKFAASDDPKFVEAAKSMTSQGQDIALQHAMQQLQSGDADAQPKLLAAAQAIVAAPLVELRPLMTIIQATRELKADQPEAATELRTIAVEGLQKLLTKEDADLESLVMASRLANFLDPPDTDAIAKANELLIARAQTDTAGETVDSKTVLSLVNMATQLEYSGDVALAGQLYDVIAAAAGKVEDEKTAAKITGEIEAAQKRVALVGQPFVVEGKLADGSTFDWKPYEGKVVLVDFWATWCGPCLQEIPNILSNYEQFHEQGFDVVGVNLDKDPKDVDDFFARGGELPWTTVFTPDEKAREFETPLAKRSGVTGIPFVVLVGKDGNVAAIHVRGEKLGEELTKIFGEPPADDVPETGIVPEDPDGETPPADPATDDAVPDGEAEPEDGAAVPETDAVPE